MTAFSVEVVAVEALSWPALVFVGTVFVWTGFVRSALGFGGAVLGLPFLLLVHDEPLLFLPIIAVHMMFFALLTTGAHIRNVDWAFLLRAWRIMIIPKLIGIFGLLTLPGNISSLIVFAIIVPYAVSYILNKPFRSDNRWLNGAFLAMGGYMSGVSLIGAPLIVAVFAAHVAAERLRDTLFMVWFIAVALKMTAFIATGVDLQLIHHVWLLPCAAVGHVLGLYCHRRLLHSTSKALFFRVIGAALLVVAIVGLVGVSS